jgi:hypothetical protein
MKEHITKVYRAKCYGCDERFDAHELKYELEIKQHHIPDRDGKYPWLFTASRLLPLMDVKWKLRGWLLAYPCEWKKFATLEEAEEYRAANYP